MIRVFAKVASTYSTLCQKAYGAALAGAAKHSLAIMLCVGVGILTAGLSELSMAQVSGGFGGNIGGEVIVGNGAGALDGGPGVGVTAGDYRIHSFVDRAFELIEGNLGALIMVAAGLGAIIAAAFGAYSMAIGLLVVAVGAFILRSLVDIFFNFS